MREALSKRSKVTAKKTTKGKTSAKLSQSSAATKLTKPKGKALSKPKPPSTPKSKSRTTAKQNSAAQSVKATSKVIASKKAVSKTSKPVAKALHKTTTGKSSPKAAASKKMTKRVVSAAKAVNKTEKAKAKATAVVRKTVAQPSSKALPKVSLEKVPARKTRKVTLPIRVVLPPPPPEPPRRSATAAALKVFEHAVRVFNRRHFEEAKEMFENLHSKYPNEVEILARSQMYLQVCTQKLANMPSAPRNADELYDRGVYALNIGDFSQAKNFFEKALRLKPEEPHLLYSLAATLAQTGSHDQALDYLRRTIQIQPRYRAQALNDSDFSELRENKQFLEMLGLASPFDILQARR